MPHPARDLARRLARRVLGRWPRPPAEPRSGSPSVRFRCNLCGKRNATAPERLGREIASCKGCGSTVRFRSLGHLVAREAFGLELPLTDLPIRRDLAGIGLSDTHLLAVPLARCSDYENTYYHAEPRLDITAIPPERRGRYDFVVASDVFEHVAPPVGRAFANALALLKPGGVLVLTVPFVPDGETCEHFPDLHDWRVDETPEGWVLHNRTADGRDEVYRDLCFHGGPGTTLEMRLFSRGGLLRELALAGFEDVRLAGEPYPPFGIAWPEPWSIPVVARRPAAPR